MPVIIDERQLERLASKKRRDRKGKSVKPSPKEERALMRKMSDLWVRVLLPTAEKLKQMVKDEASPQQLADVIQLALDRAEFEYDVQADDIVYRWKLAVDKESRAAMQKGLSKSLAVDVSAIIDEPIVADALAVGSMDAASLIKSIPGQYLGDIARSVSDNFSGTPLPEGRSLLEQIQHIGDVSQRRAELIARDQSSKLTGMINQARQTSIGIDMYIWRTSKDERVTGKPGGKWPKGNKAHGNHYAMENKYCKWNDPTVYSTDKGKTWKKRRSDMPKSHPGQDINCRCHAEPVINIDKILEKAQRL